MLTSRERLAMRAVMREALPDTALIKRATRTTDGMGGVTETYATESTVSCRVAPAGMPPWERSLAEKTTSTSAYAITLPHGTDVTVRDRIEVGAVTYEVVGLAPRGEWSLGIRAICARVD